MGNSPPSRGPCLDVATMPSPKSFEADWQIYIEWATKEYVEGRPWGPLKMSSARQVVGSTERFLTWLKDGGNLLPYAFRINAQKGARE